MQVQYAAHSVEARARRFSAIMLAWLYRNTTSSGSWSSPSGDKVSQFQTLKHHPLQVQGRHNSSKQTTWEACPSCSVKSVNLQPTRADSGALGMQEGSSEHGLSGLDWIDAASCSSVSSCISLLSVCLSVSLAGPSWPLSFFGSRVRSSQTNIWGGRDPENFWLITPSPPIFVRPPRRPLRTSRGPIANSICIKEEEKRGSQACICTITGDSQPLGHLCEHNSTYVITY